jgi:hypothetical protein
MVEARIVTVLVAEEDYKHDLWGVMRCADLRQALDESMRLDVDFIWQEDWLVSDEVPYAQDWEVHSIVNRTYRVVRGL